jgi:hypothetical protein
VTDEASEWKFRAAVFSAQQKGAKSLAQVIRMLREDYPLTADDKKALADYLEFKPKRGRRPRPAFSRKWHLQRVVGKVRDLAERKGITHQQAIEWVLYDEAELGREFEFEQVLQEVRRAAIK